MSAIMSEKTFSLFWYLCLLFATVWMRPPMIMRSNPFRIVLLFSCNSMLLKRNSTKWSSIHSQHLQLIVVLVPNKIPQGHVLSDLTSLRMCAHAFLCHMLLKYGIFHAILKAPISRTWFSSWFCKAYECLEELSHSGVSHKGNLKWASSPKATAVETSELKVRVSE